MYTKDNDVTQIQNSSRDTIRIMSSDETTQLADSKNQPSQKQAKADIKPNNSKPSATGKPKQKTIRKVTGLAGTGILIGAVATLGTEMEGATSSEISPKEENEPTIGVNLDGELQEFTIPDDGTVNDNMTFEEAFASAREAHGPGSAFEWRGNVYATYTKEEWNGMSDEEKSGFIGSLSASDTAYTTETEDTSTDEEGDTWNETPENSDNSEDIQATEEAVAALENDTIMAHVSEPTDTTTEDNEDTASADGKPEDTIMAQIVSLAQNSESLDEHVNGNLTDVDITIVSEGSGNEIADNIEIIGVVQDQENGLNVAHVNIDGEEVMVFDVDGDMVFDKIVADLNHDGVIDESEIMDISETGLSVDDLGGFTPTDNDLLASGDDMPNYLDGLLD